MTTLLDLLKLKFSEKIIQKIIEYTSGTPQELTLNRDISQYNYNETTDAYTLLNNINYSATKNSEYFYTLNSNCGVNLSFRL